MDPTRRKWWTAGLWLAAVILLALIAWRLTEAGRLPRAVGEPAALEEKLDQFAAADPYMLALKQYYPADYAELRSAMLTDLREGRTLNEVQARAMERAREQSDRRAAYVAAAPVGDLTAVIAAERAVVRRLQADNQELCAQFGMSGLPTGARTSSEAAALLSRAAEARVRA
ncbi:hypothetical protein, partial [Caulobacter sp. 17J65-9]|uniref:hypothetical protein n=1 Tax=Caulobacter sp. 17J65-9 TaxID=2709382 RepID=UPI0013C855E9